ncbi:MAG: fibronectin type III domain-containing protein [Spirochaetes bacterium]|nr:fibronectin type III domain-containing protein [Spirochaetota bacterium]
MAETPLSIVTIPGGNDMRKMIARLALLLVLSAAILSPRPDASGTMVFPAAGKKNLFNAVIQSGANGEKVYTIKDLSYRKTSDPLVTDIVLSFNTPSSRLARDDTRHYRIARSDYDFVTGKGSLGKGCAQFYKKEHGVSIQTVRGAWLGTCGDLGSFTIEFRCMPYELRDGSVLFSRVGYFSGTKRGIEITIMNGRIVAGLYGIFDRPARKKYDVVLKRGRLLTKMKWHHFSLSFDRISGKLAKLIDGEEDEVIYVTESGEAFNGVYAPSFGYREADGTLRCLDSPGASMGKNYAGLLDEFRISYRHFEDLEKITELAYRNYHAAGRIGRIPYNVEGVVTSPVYSLPGTGTMAQEFRWKEILEPDTFIWMEFRISDSRFKENDTAPDWYRIANNQKKIFLMKNSDGSYLRGKYCQWRAHLVASPDGKLAPRLSGIEMDYRLDLPPAPPQFLEATAAGSRSIVLTWKKNVDHDILGYRIYYGTYPGRYDGVLSTINGVRITNATASGTSISVTITNDIIDENRPHDRKEKLSFPFLQSTVLYYFAVAAYDSYKPDTDYNHESDLSAPVTVRPFEGTEIR